MKTKLHIVSFDVPYPSNYGGIIDVYERIKELHKLDVEIYLHCFLYNHKKAQPHLDIFCKKVFYYKRNIGLKGLSLIYPYIIYSRKNKNLLKNLIEINAPILFEGVHTCFYINRKELNNRNKIVRMHNIEQDYYQQLCAVSQSFFKKWYYKFESKLITNFQSTLNFSTSIACVSTEDENYFKKVFPDKNVVLIPSQNTHQLLEIKQGKGNYCFYHGNLGVIENINSVKFLIEKVFLNLQQILIIAGSNADESFKKYLLKFDFVSLIEHPDEKKMKQLMQDAHIHVLPTFQNTGLKLKLINSLFTARFVLCNTAMVKGSRLETICYNANSIAHFQQRIVELMQAEISISEIENRKIILNELFNNTENVKKFLALIK